MYLQYLFIELLNKDDNDFKVLSYFWSNSKYFSKGNKCVFIKIKYNLYLVSKLINIYLKQSYYL